MTTRIGLLQLVPPSLVTLAMVVSTVVFADQPGDFAKETLDAHNCYRAAHGVPPLEWSEAVAEYARKWIDENGYKHSDSYHSNVGPMGENLYSGTNASGKAAVALWYSEVTDPGYAFGSSDGRRGTGHFTAMIWKDAKYLGCGKSGEVISCNYWSGKQEIDCSTPNIRGCYSEQVSKAIEESGNCD